MDLTAREILKSEVRPALGCTEPAAAALAAAAAASLLPRRIPEKIEVRLDANVYKNALAAVVPGGGGGKGPALAAALGALGGDAHLGLQVLAPVDAGRLAEAAGLVAAGRVEVTPDYNEQGIFVSVRIMTDGQTAEAVIRDRHDRLTRLRLDGREVSSPLIVDEKTGGKNMVSHEQLRRLTLARLLAMTESLDDEDLAFIREGVIMNRRLAEHGLGVPSGLGVGRALRKILERDNRGQDLIAAARCHAAAAADARMAGAPLPAMSSAGSGNHGLTAVLPVWTLFESLGGDEIGRAHV